MTLILRQSEVRSLLTMSACMELVAKGLEELARDQALNPLRSMLWKPDHSGLLGMMPGYLDAPSTLGIKIVGVFPGNHGTPLDSHQGFVALFDAEDGAPTAILEGSAITAIRTAAVSGVATRLLARPDAKVLALLGSGVQARTHLAAMLEARELSDVRVHSPTRANREAFAAQATERHGLPVRACERTEDAVRGADIVCTVSSAREPILEGTWLAPGSHINAAGASIKSARELDDVAVQRSRLFVDRMESAQNEAGDYLIPLASGAIQASHIEGELGDLLLGKIDGRRTPEELTLFKSLGLAVEDLVTARYVADRAREQGLGTEVDLRGLKDEPR